MSSRLTLRVVIAFRNWSQVTIRGLTALLQFFRSLSARSCSVITVSTRAPVVQAIHPQINKGDRKQTLYNLFAAYIHTVPRE